MRAHDGGDRQADVCELSITQMKTMLAAGETTSTELVVSYLNRLLYYDVNGIHLNSMPIIARDALSDAMVSDDARAQGNRIGPLQGIPYSVKDSYMAEGMTMAAGSPAFAGVVANEDSFSVHALRSAGAILLGRTTMPPMAAGGLQRGLYGRAESPYNSDYLAGAWYSGSSNGSAVSTASSFAAFGLGEETVSSGRSPAANNGLVAYTPSRGVISLRGNWPLHATKDVVVPYARTMSDLLQILPPLLGDDPDTRGDMWRWQHSVPLEGAKRIHARGVEGITDMNALRTMHIGIVNEYAGRPGGVIPAVYTRPSITTLLLRAVDDLGKLGADVRWTSLPLRDAYDSAPRTLKTFTDAGMLPPNWMQHEWLQLNTAVLEEFIKEFDIEGITSLLDVDPDDIFPNPLNSIDHRIGRRYGFYRQANAYIRSGHMVPAAQTPDLAKGLKGLEAIRKHYFEQWLRSENLDLLVFPTNSNIAHADADVDMAHSTEAWQDGTWFSNGNRMIRHLGIPSVSVSMGVMDDTGVPAGLTFIGPSGSDRLLLACAYEYEQSTRRRIAPRRTPPLEQLPRIRIDASADGVIGRTFRATLHVQADRHTVAYTVELEEPDQRVACRVFINGLLMEEWDAGDTWSGSVSTARFFDARLIGIVVLVTGSRGRIGADVAVCRRPDFAGLHNSLI